MPRCKNCGAEHAVKMAKSEGGSSVSAAKNAASTLLWAMQEPTKNRREKSNAYLALLFGKVVF